MTDHCFNLLGLGQSNIANHGGARREAPGASVRFDGAIVPLADPVPGGSGSDGSVWTRLAPLLSDGGRNDVCVTLAGQGGTSVAEWLPGGMLFSKLEQRISLGDTNNITHVIFQQGEKDTLLGTTTEVYEASFKTLFDAVNARIGEVPWIICRSSWRFGVVSEAVTSAQTRLAETLPGAIAGPDLDLLGTDYRRDNTHFNDRGLDAFADGLASCLLPQRAGPAL